MKQPGLYVVHAAAVRDAAGVNARPGSVMIWAGNIHAIGDPGSFDKELLERSTVIDRSGSLLLPAMVNAHTHLELTGIGPQPYHPTGGFVEWVKMVRKRSQEADASDAVKSGAQQALHAGIQAVGDIAGSIKLSEARHNRGLGGVTFLELFGLGAPFDVRSLSAFQEVNAKKSEYVRCRSYSFDGLGFQPHAPYSAGHRLFAEASWYGPSATHLAETMEEAEFVGSLKGPLFDYVRELGRWDDSFKDRYGRGLSPVQWMRMYLEAKGGPYASHRWLVAHCNYIDDDDLKLLADTKTSVAYCPIASEYFGHKSHRYRDMLDAGINVCLGTDSIVCAMPDDPQPLGLMGAMRRLYQRDQTSPDVLLAMATVNGAKALHILDARTAKLVQGAPAKFACIKIDTESPVDPLEQALTSREPVEALSFEATESV